jgi:hypothetical protein
MPHNQVIVDQLQLVANELLRIDIKHLELTICARPEIFAPLISSHPTVQKLSLTLGEDGSLIRLGALALSNNRLIDLHIRAPTIGFSPIVLTNSLRHLSLHLYTTNQASRLKIHKISNRSRLRFKVY